MGHAVVRPLQPHRGDDAGLVIVPADRADAGGLAHHRAAALGADHQRRRQHAAVRQGDRAPAGRRPRQPDRAPAPAPRCRRRAPPRPGRRGCGGSRPCSPAARRRCGRAISAASKRRKAGERRARRRAGRAAVGDQDLLDPLGVGPQGFADAERPPLAEGRIGDGRGAAVEGRRQSGRRTAADRSARPSARPAPGQRQGRAGHAGAGDDDIVAINLAHALDVARRAAGVQRPRRRGQ